MGRDASDATDASGTPALWFIHGDGDGDGGGDTDAAQGPIGACVNPGLLRVLRSTLNHTYTVEPGRPKREVRRACQNRAEMLVIREQELRERGTLTESQILTQLVSLADSQLPECEDRLVARATSQSRNARLCSLQQKLDEANCPPCQHTAAKIMAPSVTHAVQAKYTGYDDAQKIRAMFKKAAAQFSQGTTAGETQQHIQEAVHKRMKQLWKSKLTIASSTVTTEGGPPAQTATLYQMAMAEASPAKLTARQQAVDGCGGRVPTEGVAEWQFESRASTDHTRRLAALNEALFTTKTGFGTSPFGTVPGVQLPPCPMAAMDKKTTRERVALIGKLSPAYLTLALRHNK